MGFGNELQRVKSNADKPVTQNARVFSMAWETRNGKGQYYTRCRRVNGRVVREYYGSGMLANLLAMEDDIRRQKRQQQRQETMSIKSHFARLAAVHELWDKCLQEITSKTLHRNHQRGNTWQSTIKLQRGRAMQTNNQPATSTHNAKSHADDLLIRAQKGDETCLPELEKRFDEDPGLWRHFSDLFNIVLEHSLNKTVGKDLLSKGALKRKVLMMIKDWSGTGSAYEIASAQRLALLHMETYVADLFRIEARQKAGDNYLFLQTLEKLYDTVQQRFTKALDNHTNLCQKMSKLQFLWKDQEAVHVKVTEKKKRTRKKKPSAVCAQHSKDAPQYQSQTLRDLEQTMTLARNRIAELVQQN